MNHYPRPASDLSLKLCHAIESAGASEKLTECSVLASQLRAHVLTMEEALNDIHDFDDGAWAAGKHQEEAEKLGRVSIRSIADEALGKVRKAEDAPPLSNVVSPTS